HRPTHPRPTTRIHQHPPQPGRLRTRHRHPPPHPRPPRPRLAPHRTTRPIRRPHLRHPQPSRRMGLPRPRGRPPSPLHSPRPGPLTPPPTPHRFLPPTAPRRRIRALLALGWPHPELHARSGVRTSVTLNQAGEWVTRATADAITALYNDLAMTPGPSARTRA